MGKAQRDWGWGQPAGRERSEPDDIVQYSTGVPLFLEERGAGGILDNDVVGQDAGLSYGIAETMGPDVDWRWRERQVGFLLQIYPATAHMQFLGDQVV